MSHISPRLWHHHALALWPFLYHVSSISGTTGSPSFWNCTVGISSIKLCKLRWVVTTNSHTDQPIDCHSLFSCTKLYHCLNIYIYMQNNLASIRVVENWTCIYPYQIFGSSSGEFNWPSHFSDQMSTGKHYSPVLVCILQTITAELLVHSWTVGIQVGAT